MKSFNQTIVIVPDIVHTETGKKIGIFASFFIAKFRAFCPNKLPAEVKIFQ